MYSYNAMEGHLEGVELVPPILLDLTTHWRVTWTAPRLATLPFLAPDRKPGTNFYSLDERGATSQDFNPQTSG